MGGATKSNTRLTRLLYDGDVGSTEHAYGDDDRDTHQSRASALKCLQSNIKGFIDHEMLEYTLDHAREYGVADIERLQQILIDYHIKRADRLDNAPMFVFLTMVAGALRRSPERLYKHNPKKQKAHIHALLREHARLVTAGESDINYGSEVLKGLLQDREVTGLLRLEPEVLMATRRVMSDLRNRRGCGSVKPFEELLLHEDLRIKLADLTALQILMYHQTDPRRPYKLSDYRHLLDTRQMQWDQFAHLLARTPGTGVTPGGIRLKRRCLVARADFG